MGSTLCVTTSVESLLLLAHKNETNQLGGFTLPVGGFVLLLLWEVAISFAPCMCSGGGYCYVDGRFTSLLNLYLTHKGCRRPSTDELLRREDATFNRAKALCLLAT
jgi:hypothetical protein